MKILDIFKKKKIKTVDVIVTSGNWCPNCKDDGALFHHYNSSYKGYICENCLKRFSEEEYDKLLKISQRKEKLSKLNNI